MAFAAPSLRLRCAFAAPSLRLRCAFAAPPAFSFSAKLSTRFLMISLLCLAFCGAPFVSTGQNVQVTPVGLFDNVFDRFGGKHKLADIVIATPQNQAFLRQIGAGNAVAAVQPACATSGYFRLFANNGGAYTTHTAQVAVLCQVLSDISDFLPRPTTATGTVDIFLSDWGVLTPPSPNASAMATSMYSYPLLNTPTGGVLEGEVWKTINGGKDSYQGIVPPILTTTNGISGLNFYHGLISFNTNLNWHTDLQIPPTNTELDMYSVMLHEVTHMLGFASLISSNGQSIIHPNPTYYSLYDTFLQTADGIPLLSSTNDCDSEMYDNLYDTNLINNLGNGICGITMPDPNTTDCHTAIVYNNNSTVQRQEVYNPACYARGSSLSHFEDECESLTHAAQNDLYFVMSNSNGFGQHYEKHYLKPEERSVLCDLGYEVLDSYGTSSVEQLPFSYGATSACTDRRPVGYNDGINTTSTGTYSYTTSLGTAISIYDILSNDTNTDIASCYEVISGTGAFTAQTGQGFTYNPAATGLHLIRYIPISSTGRKGNITYVFIYVFAANSPSCGITACNRVANSGFEVGNNCGPWYQQSPPACWNALQGTPDAYQLNCPIANLFSFGQQGYYAINPFPYNQTATGVTNFAYMGLVCEDRPTLVWDEAMQTTLTTPLVAGVSYRIKFHAATSMSTSPPQLIVAASPQTISPDVLGNFDNLQNNTLIQFFGTSAIIPINNNGFWDEYQAVFTYTPTSGAAPDLHNLIITTNHHLLVPSPTTNVLRFYVYIDDISLEEDDGGLPFTLPTCFQAGTAIALDANITIPTITFTGDDILNNVLTPVAGHGNYTIYYHYLKLNGCVVEGSQQINENTIPPIILMNGTPCLGQPTMLHVNTGSGFSWSTGELTHTITVSPTSPTTYTVTVTFCTGVTATTSITVTPILTTPVSIDVADPCAVGNTDISVTPATLLDYAWNTGQSGQNLSTLTVQTGALYTVTATDSNGCTSTANTFVNQPPTVFITGVNVYAGYAIILSSNASSAAHAIGANGGAMFTYEWSNGDTNNSTTINAIGIYTVTVTDSGIYGTCTASATFEVVTCRPNTQVAVHIGAPNTTTFWSLLPT
ncbi:MAG: hypothetical protein RI894_535, partial [Bacteroidota bacterium]